MNAIQHKQDPTVARMVEDSRSRGLCVCVCYKIVVSCVANSS